MRPGDTPISHFPAPQECDLLRTLLTETYSIVAQAHAHEGSIFALCLRRDGTVLSGGGRDRRLVQWGPAQLGPGLVALQEAEVRSGWQGAEKLREWEEEAPCP